MLLGAAGIQPALAQRNGAADSSHLANGTTLYGLPVLKSYVAPDAVERAKKKYGRALYSIEKSQAPNCRESYLVGLLRNRRLTVEWMCDDPKMVFHVRKSAFLHPWDASYLPEQFSADYPMR